MSINEHIAKRILELRKAKNLTAEKLAWSADLSKSCVSYAEKGTKDIKISTINSFSNFILSKLVEEFPM